MACERRWLSYCCMNLFIIALGFSIVIAKRGDSLYHYDISSLAQSDNAAKEFIKFYPHDELRRKRRSPIELESSTTVPLFSKTTIEPISGPENVAYSTDNSKISSTLSTLIEDNQTETDVTVSQPLNPATEKADPVQPTVWANQTWHHPTPLQPSANGTENGTNPNVDVGDADLDSDEININKFDDLTNSTLSKNNVPRTINDTHQYYNSSLFVDEIAAKKFWINLDEHPNATVNHVLSYSYRKASTVKLSFDFPFYGHPIRNVTITTGGFLWTGEWVHSWLASTQYIAPLMANFDTRLSNNSYVKYADNGTAFTVEWENVVLQEQPTPGAFTFQVTLHQNGDIVFIYAAVPLAINQIQNNSHPVKVGLSDAYVMEITEYFLKRRRLYEYHSISFMDQDIENWTVIYLSALPTCIQLDNCNDCVNRSTGFKCKWCPSLNRCSTGTDRHKQDWMVSKCESNNIKEGETCPVINNNTATYDEHEDDTQAVHEPKETIRDTGVLSANVQP